MIREPEDNGIVWEGFCCDCMGGHSLQVNYISAGNGDPEQLYVSVMMDLKAWPLWQRVKLAWRLIRGYSSTIEEVILGGKDIERFLDYEADVRRVKKAAEASPQLPVLQSQQEADKAAEGRQTENKGTSNVAFLSTRVGALEKRTEELEQKAGLLVITVNGLVAKSLSKEQRESK